MSDTFLQYTEVDHSDNDDDNDNDNDDDDDAKTNNNRITSLQFITFFFILRLPLNNTFNRLSASGCCRSVVLLQLLNCNTTSKSRDSLNVEAPEVAYASDPHCQLR